jgi:methylmalonyl-CoA mutase
MAGFPQKTFQEALREIELFAEDEGRRPRMLVVKLGQDGDDRGARAIAIAFADIGFDVDVGPPSQTPEDAARQAIENDVHVVGVSTEAADQTALIQALKDQGGNDILVMTRGICGPEANIPAAAAEILGVIRDKRKAA